MKRLLFLLLFGLTAQFLVSCYPEDANSVDDYNVAMTNYDKQFDFKTLSTFAMPDTVAIIVDGKAGEIKDFNDQQILDKVKANFEALGYTYVPNATPTANATPQTTNGTPSFLVTVSAVSVRNFTYYYDNWYNSWSYWWNSYWPGFDFYPPYYSWYPTSIVYSYQSGSIVIEMVSTTAREDKKLNVYWTGIADGILTGDTAYDQTQLQNGIDQCFLQSPYLKK